MDLDAKSIFEFAMDISTIPGPLGEPEQTKNWLAEHRFHDADRALKNLCSLAGHVPSLDESWLARLLVQLQAVADPDRSLNNLERFVSSHGRDSRLEQFLSDPNFDGWLILFSDSQYLSDFLVRHFEAYWSLRDRPDELVAKRVLEQRMREQLMPVGSAGSVRELRQSLRYFKLIEMTRIAFGDLVTDDRVDQVVGQISSLAEVIIDAALRWIFAKQVEQIGQPETADGDPARFVVLGMGKLGGGELNYSSDIDLVMVYECDNQGSNRGSVSNREFFERLTRDLVSLLGEATQQGAIYRVDLRLRPEGSRGRICSSLKSMLHYYDFQGRTWERQALLKARPVAGDLSLGAELLQQLEHWIYRTYLNRHDIDGIKALKRRIERKTISRGEEQSNIKSGHGGIRDVEFVIQFLQLLNGGVTSEIQSSSTLTAIAQLESAGCLTIAEATLLTSHYCWLRKLEHRLQLLFDLQTHVVPDAKRERQQFAFRMGLKGPDALQRFESELIKVTTANRTILNHVLHDAFGMNFGSLRDSLGQLVFRNEPTVPPEVELVLEPSPAEHQIEQTLAPFGFGNLPRAYRNLMELAHESTPFLSTRRCHHFLAAIAPLLLREIAETPDPDATLNSLAAVSQSLGAKSVLWELFSFNPPTLKLYVRMCATAEYLARILKSNPGMIDELVDSLLVESLPDYQFFEQSLAELVRGAKDIEPIVHSFKNAEHLRVGIRDIVGRDDIRTTHRALSDIAEVCLREIARSGFVEHFSENAPGASKGWDELEPRCPFVILALGKLGGREPNYHSDLDLIFLYQHDPEWEAELHPGVTGQFFFSELAARITRFLSRSKKLGKLFDVDCRLRPTGKSGTLANSFDEFSRYFESGKGWLWERQALCKARPVFGNDAMQREARQRIRKSIAATPWQPAMALDILASLEKIRRTASPANLKKAPGGTMDVEFAIQAIQLRHAHPDRDMETGTLQAIDAMIKDGRLETRIGLDLKAGYRFLRSVEARLRLINTHARHDLPEDKILLDKLAILMQASSTQSFVDHVDKARRLISRRVEQVFRALSQEPA